MIFRRTIAVDFDGVLCCSPYPKANRQNWLNKIVLKYLRYRQKKGDAIVIWTCRTDDRRIGDSSLGKARLFLRKLDFYPDAFNENILERTEYYGVSSRKISADRYIDDRNVGVLGWLFRATYNHSLKSLRRKCV